MYRKLSARRVHAGGVIGPDAAEHAEAIGGFQAPAVRSQHITATAGMDEIPMPTGHLSRPQPRGNTVVVSLQSASFGCFATLRSRVRTRADAMQRTAARPTKPGGQCEIIEGARHAHQVA